MFIATLSVREQSWKQSKCPSMGILINKYWYIHIMQYYYNSKKKWIISIHDNMDKSQLHHAMWNNPDSKTYVSCIWNSRKGTIIIKKNRSVIARSWGGERGVNAKGHKEIWGMNKVVHYGAGYITEYKHLSKLT